MITPAFAQAAGGSGSTDMLLQIMPLVLVGVIFYFLLIRPQQKRSRDHQSLLKNIRRGDTVITNGGFIGKVTKAVDDNELEVEIADNVRVRVVRGMVADVRAKGEPAKD